MGARGRCSQDPAVIGLRMAGTVHPRHPGGEGRALRQGTAQPRSAAHPRGQGDRRGNHAGPRRADADRPEVPAGRHAAEPIRSGIPADAGETGNGYENPPEDATDRDDTPPKAGAEESDTRILPAQEGKTDLGRDESGDLDPARARDVSGQFGARMRRSETYYPTSPRSWKGS